MECEKCGKVLSEQEKFCTYCGHYNEPNKDNNNIKKTESDKKNIETSNELAEISINEYEDKTSFKSKCLKIFLSSDYKNIISGGFNLYAMLFSWIYFLYKKMYLIGIIGLVIAGILVIYQRIILIVYAILSMLISGLFFNKIYLLIAKKKIDKIISKNENKQDILNLVKKAGNENILLTLSIYFIFLIVIIFLYLNLDKEVGISDKFWQDNNSNKAACLSMVQTSKKLSQINKVAFILEAECFVINNNTKQFEVYLKFDKGNQIVIEKYKTEDYKMKFVANTDLLKEYETRLGNLTDSEKEQYNQMLNLTKEYSKINQNAKQEEELIKNGNNITARKYFILNEEEVNR